MIDCEWGMGGVVAMRGRVAVLVIVDVLSFSTCVDVAVARGAVVHPFRFGDGAAARAEAERLGAELAVRREDPGRYSLSPASLATIPSGTAVLLPSPNGSTLSLAGGSAIVLAGGPRNAAAVARAATSLANGGGIGVVPAGERWPDGSLRPAIEDLLGAGAIIHHLAGEMSAEAIVARDAYRAGLPDLARLIGGSVSGRELVDRGFPDDIRMAAEMDASVCVPRLTDGAYRAF
jgi:2-phosphosulfolactate phosphatase